ncbi:hypothetical protein VNO77_20457 [Canavalia gladiata]|uniref:Uncharacterized protein n=1 Tax=Canavalia gladiata TaxID=3824 RepID=A0AAN9LP97_CANGL
MNNETYHNENQCHLSSSSVTLVPSEDFSKSSNCKYLYPEENRSVVHVTLHASRDVIIQNGEKNVVSQDWKVFGKIKKFPKSIYNESWDGNTEKIVNATHICSVIVDSDGYKYEILEKDSTPEFFTSYDEVYDSLDVIQQAQSEIGKSTTFFSRILQQLDFGLVHY